MEQLLLFHIEENGIRLASPRDIAAMKINAIEGRGTKKDFIDIYFLLQQDVYKRQVYSYRQTGRTGQCP